MLRAKKENNIEDVSMSGLSSCANSKNSKRSSPTRHSKISKNAPQDTMASMVKIVIDDVMTKEDTSCATTVKRKKSKSKKLK